MAVRTILVDDLTGKDADESVVFGIRGKNYKIDLSRDNVTKLIKALEPFIEKARPIPPATANGHDRRTARQERDRIRMWAQENGMDVSDKGRIPAQVVAAFRVGGY